MTAAHEELIRERLLNDAVNELCPRTGIGRDRDSKAREKTVRQYGGRFLERMHGDSPFASEEDAIAALSPIAIWVFRWALRQLVIQVIKFLWRRMHPPTSVEITAKAKDFGNYSM